VSVSPKTSDVKFGFDYLSLERKQLGGES